MLQQFLVGVIFEHVKITQICCLLWIKKWKTNCQLMQWKQILTHILDRIWVFITLKVKDTFTENVWTIICKLAMLFLKWSLIAKLSKHLTPLLGEKQNLSIFYAFKFFLRMYILESSCYKEKEMNFKNLVKKLQLTKTK